jgi:hypothetical protein
MKSFSQLFNRKAAATDVLAAVALAQNTTPEAIISQVAAHAAATATSRDQLRMCATNVIDNTNGEAARRLERATAEANELIARAQAMVAAAEKDNEQLLSQAAIAASLKLAEAQKLDTTVRQLNLALQAV